MRPLLLPTQSFAVAWPRRPRVLPITACRAMRSLGFSALSVALTRPHAVASQLMLGLVFLVHFRLRSSSKAFRGLELILHCRKQGLSCCDFGGSANFPARLSSGNCKALGPIRRCRTRDSHYSAHREQLLKRPWSATASIVVINHNAAQASQVSCTSWSPRSLELV